MGLVIADFRLPIADFFDVRRTLVCRAWSSASLKNPRAKIQTHDKLKFVGHRRNRQLAIGNRQ
jgi:hypothetical protein